MSLWILDTDHYSLLQRNETLIVQRIATINQNDIAITIITAEEQLRGRLAMIGKASQPLDATKIVSAYTRLQDTLEDFKSINIIKFDNSASTSYLELRRQKIRIGSQDLKIAAIVLSVNGILVTRNQRDFSQVPGLRFEDWTIR